jgi:Arc/MetJ family transcription regulator
MSEQEDPGMKRTTIMLDERLIAKGKKLTGLKTASALIDHALRELIRHRRQRQILRLQGQVNREGDLAAMRRRRKLP